MKNTIKKTAMLATIGLLLSMPPALATDINIIPQPLKTEVAAGSFTLNAKTRILCSPALQQEACYLQQALHQSTLLPLNIGQGKPAKNTISLSVDTVAVGHAEGYVLKVSTDRIEILARQPQGAFYAIQSLLQLMPHEVYAATPQTGVSWTVPSVSIEDEPTWSWRGLMLDVSRYFHDAEFLRKYIDMMATYKLNVLQLHLVDDAGWRLEIKKYPLLTEIGAWAGDDVHRLGGFYTQDEMRQLVAYAQVRGVTIVPEIEFPAHLLSAIAAYPWLSCKGGENKVQTQGYISDQIMCAGNEDCFKFLEDVFSEVCDIFPSRYVNIGGDEAVYTEWKACPKCQQLKDRLGLKDESELQGYVTNRAIDILKKHGRTVTGWNEIAERGPLNAPVVANCWHEPEKAAELIAQGHFAVLSPVKNYYFDMPESLTPGEVQAATWSTPISLADAYALRPELYGKPSQLLGVQGCLWSDQFIVGEKLQEIDALDENRSERYIEYLSFPRALALAEAGWTAPALRSYDSFCQRLACSFDIITMKGCHYRVPEPIITTSPTADGKTLVTLSSPVRGARLRYRTDGHRPTPHSSIYTAPIVVDNPNQLQAVTEVSLRHYSLPATIPSGNTEKP